MKRIRKFAAVNVIAALIGAGVPAMAAQNGYGVYKRGGMQYQSADHQNREFRKDDRWDRDRRDRNYDPRDHSRRYRDDRGYSYGYAPAPVYQPAPVYDNGYYRDRTHNGRTAAIIAGSAAAGALIGGATGHGRGAVIGAVIGGIAGAAASAAADHHDRY